jgi:endonuclease-8
VPEGHTIHRAARLHGRLFAGQALQVSSPQGRFTEGAKLVDGARLQRTEAYGKHEFAWFDDGLLVHVHLGLFGRWRLHRELPAPEPRGAVRMRWVGEDAAIDLLGPTACAVGDRALYERIVARLGPDPLRRNADPQRFVARAGGSRSEIGRLLMDQAVVAGIGNVFRAEALFVNGIWPERAGRELGDERLQALWATMAEMLRAGARRSGRIATVAPAELAAVPGRRRGERRTYVYKRNACLRCSTEIRRWDMAGRWCYACPTCQR